MIRLDVLFLPLYCSSHPWQLLPVIILRSLLDLPLLSSEDLIVFFLRMTSQSSTPASSYASRKPEKVSCTFNFFRSRIGFIGSRFSSTKPSTNHDGRPPLVHIRRQGSARASSRPRSPDLADAEFFVQNEPVFVTFLTAGYPTIASTVPMMLAMEAGGANVIELGVPFTDPLADGKAIQDANNVSSRSRTFIPVDPVQFRCDYSKSTMHRRSRSSGGIAFLAAWTAQTLLELQADRIASLCRSLSTKESTTQCVFISSKLLETKD